MLWGPPRSIFCTASGMVLPPLRGPTSSASRELLLVGIHLIGLQDRKIDRAAGPETAVLSCSNSRLLIIVF
jgi:hypothetical protein